MSKAGATDELSRHIRRLRSTDLNAFRSLQDYAPHSKHSRALHDKWVFKAAREITIGERIGYGLFDVDKGDPPSLLGCILLRRTSSNVIELKNLVVDPKCDGKKYLSIKQVSEALVDRAELASKYRGFSQLEIELLSTDYEQIQLFLSLGYAIQPSHESVPSIEVPHYVLWKHVQPEYHGDPFDDLSMAKWFLAKRMQWPITQEELIRGANGERLAFRLRFDLPWQMRFSARARRGWDGTAQKSSADETTGEREVQKRFRFTGDCIVDSGAGDVADVIALLEREAGLDAEPSERPAVRFLLSTRQLEGTESSARRAGFRPVLGGELLRLIGYSSANQPFVLRENAVQGVLVHVGPLDFAKLREYCTSGTPFSYVILSGVGEAIYEGWARDESAEFFAVFCTDDEDGRMVVVGWAQVEFPVPKRAEDVEDELRGRKTLWPEQPGFFINTFSANFQENDIVYVLHLKEPRLLVEPFLPLSEVGAADAAVKPLLADAERYGFSACYAEKLVQLVRAKPHEEWDFAPRNASVDSPIELVLLEGLTYSLFAIRESRWLQSILQEKSPDLTASQLADEISRENGKIGQVRNAIGQKEREQPSSGNRQRMLFVVPAVPPDLMSKLRDTLTKVRRAYTEFDRQTNRPNPEDGPGPASLHAKNVCVRMMDALEIARGLALTATVPEKLEQWLYTISRHRRKYWIGLTFSGKYREKIVKPVATALAGKITDGRVFYYEFHTISQLRANEMLPEIYANDCELVVAFLSDSYGDGWTSLEWEKVGQLARTEPDRVMLLKLTDFDGTKLGIHDAEDIYYDIRKGSRAFLDPVIVRDKILERLRQVCPDCRWSP